MVALANYTSLATTSDNCGSIASVTQSPPAGTSILGETTTTVTLTVTDSNGNQNTCDFDVITVDTTDPAITCPADITTSNDTGDCSAVVTYTAPVGTDDCTGASTTQTAGLPSGSAFPVGTTTNTFEVTDAAGNSTTCSFTVTVNDTEDPAITCPADISVTGTSSAGAVVTYTTPVGTDNCTGATTTQTAGLPSGSTFPLGTTTNTFEVEDASGNTTSCSFTVEVTGVPPSIVCPADIVVDNDSGNCDAIVTFAATETTGVPASVITYSQDPGTAFPVGVTTVTATATNAVGTDQCTFTITVNDTEAPAITCPADITVSNDTGDCSAVVTYTTPVGTDNCTGATTTQTAGLPSGSAFPVGTTTNTFVVTDGAGLTATCSFDVTVNDTEDPAITCPADITTSNDTGDCSAVVNYTTPVGTDNCTGATTTQTAGLASGSTFPVGVTTNTFEVTDAAGNTATCSFDVTVNDTEDPAITCPADVTTSNDTGDCSAVVTYTTPVGSDNCTGATTTQTAGLPSGSAFPVGTTTNTFVVTDGAGNTATCSFDVTVNDTEDPAITCPADITVSNDTGDCSAVVTYTTPVGTDNCTGATTTQTAGLPSGSAFPVGTTTNTFVVTDAAGLTATCSFDVTVNDTEDPAITCPADITTSNDTGDCSAVVTYTTPVGTDNCTGATTTQTAGLASGSTFPVGVTTNTFEVTDAAGNTATCSFDVTVNDTEDPAITCPADVTTSNDTGDCSAVVTYTTPVGSDNCTGATTTQTAGLPSGSAFPVGTTTNTFVVTDGAGLTATCSFDVTVTDTEAPTITCPANISVNNDAGVCGAVVNYTPPVGMDNCAGSTITFSESFTNGQTSTHCNSWNNFRSQLLSTLSYTRVTIKGSNDPVGVSVTDPSKVLQLANGLRDGANVTIADGGLNWITGGCGFEDNSGGTPAIALSATGATCSCETTGYVVRPCIDVYTSNPNWGGAGTAVCSGPTQTLTVEFEIGSTSTVQTAGLPSGSVFPVGTTTNTFEVTDGAGLTTSCSFDVVVTDTEAPAITCPATISVNNDAGICGAAVTYTAPVGTDNCTGATTAQTAGLASGSVFPVGTTTNTFEVTDAAGNTTICSFDVTVNDTEDPAITCPADITTSNDTGDCSAVVTYTTPVGTDNCTGATTTQTAGLPSGSAFPVGTTTNTFEVTDAAGNTATCSFDVTVNDTEDPAITCPADITTSNDTGDCSAVVTYTTPVGTDNCTGATTTQTAGLPSGSAFPVGTTTNTFEVTDAAGNTTICSFDVTVNDTEDPAITCPADITVSNDTGDCSAVVTYTTPVGTDNCTGATTTQTAGLPSGSAFPVGTTTNTFVVTDAAGNTTICSFDVTVNDTEDPAITCPADITTSNDTGDCSAVVTYTTPVGTDNCTGATTIQTAGLPSGSTFPLGITANEFEVTDASGNTTSCSFTVTVNDTEDPTWVIPPSDLTVECDGTGNVSEFDNWLNITFTGTDNCTGVTVTNDSSGLSDDCGATGTETVTFTLTDSNGNSITLDATFTIVDTINPIMDVAASDLIIQCDDDNSAEIDAWLATNGGASASDACSGITWTNDFTTVNEDVCGALTTVTFTATDECGNFVTTEANINTEDTIPPVIGCPGDVTAVTEDGDCGAIVVFQPAVAIDNCGTAFVYQTGGLGSGSVFPVGDTLIEYTAQDECGNLATCTFTVTVIDDDAPVAICQDLTVILDDTGNATITANQLNFGSNDNCGIGNLDIDIDTFDCSNVGANQVTLTVTDIHGNTATCVSTVTVLDLTDPIAVCQDITLELGDDGTVTIDPLAVDGGSSDACGIASYELNIDTLDCSNLGNTTVILTVTDVNGNESSCSAIVTLEDNTPLELVCNDVTVELNQDGVAFITPSLVADVIDGCGTSTVTVDVEEVSCADIGTPVTVNVFANDGNGNSAVCSAVVTVVDLLGPQIVCPDDQVVNLDADGTYTLGDYIGDGSATVTDNCTDPVTIFSQDPAPGTSLGLGLQVVTFSAEDEYGNISTCSFELDVQDILGNNNTEDFASLVLYPNPADSKVNLSNPRQIDLNNVTIYDLTGRIVNKIDLTTMGSEITIDISTLANATYMLVIKGSQGTSTKQLIVNNY